MEAKRMDRLYDACYNANWSLVLQLLSKGISVQYQHPKNGMSSLYVAVARKAPIEVLKRLILGGHADPNLGDDKGFTPLHAACEYHAPTDVVQLLLEAGADPNQKALDGATALHFAAQYVVRKPVLRALLDAGADVNARKLNGATPLFTAVENSATAAHVRMLLDAGADPHIELLNPRTGKYDTPLSIAKRKCLADVLAVLEEQETNMSMGRNSVPHTGNFSKKVEKARLLFRYAVTSNSLLTVGETQSGDDAHDNELLPVREGEKVQLIHGNLEEGLHAPYEEFVLVSTDDGKTGRVPRRSLYDHGSTMITEL